MTKTFSELLAAELARVRVTPVVLAVAMTGCTFETYEFCEEIDPSADCPDAVDVEAPQSPCTDPALDYLGGPVSFVERKDDVDVTSGFEPEPRIGTLCCYSALYAQKPGESCVVGRPLRDAATDAVRAPVASAAGWQAPRTPDVASLSAEARTRLAAVWLDAAREEHASVASFSALALHLLALGAPSELVEAAHVAAQDEVRHARDAFALASAYAGEPLGPGPLDVPPSALTPRSLAELAAESVRDGCVNETLASVLAATQRAHATDPAVQAVLDDVVRDEARHASLAWRIVRWAIGQGGDEVRRAVSDAFDTAEAQWADDGAVEGLDATAAHGGLPAGLLRSAAAGAFARVVRPAADGLLAA